MTVAVPGYGGAREGAGRKSAAEQAEPSAVLYSESRARKEAALAGIAEHDLGVKAGSLLPRDQVKLAASISFASFVQTMRSVPDNLERDLGITPECAEAIGVAIDEALADLGQQFKAMAGE